MRACVRACVCVCGRNEFEVYTTLAYIHILVYTHKHTRPKTIEDSKPTGLKVDIANDSCIKMGSDGSHFNVS